MQNFNKMGRGEFAKCIAYGAFQELLAPKYASQFPRVLSWKVYRSFAENSLGEMNMQSTIRVVVSLGRRASE